MELPVLGEPECGHRDDPYFMRKKIFRSFRKMLGKIIDLADRSLSIQSVLSAFSIIAETISHQEERKDSDSDQQHGPLLRDDDHKNSLNLGQDDEYKVNQYSC